MNMDSICGGRNKVLALSFDAHTQKRDVMSCKYLRASQKEWGNHQDGQKAPVRDVKGTIENRVS